MNTRKRVRALRCVPIWALILPVSINGLGMVCVVPPDPPVPIVSAEVSVADCSAACALPRPDADVASELSSPDSPAGGVLCLLVPTDHTECMAASTVAMSLPVASAVVLDTESTAPEPAPDPSVFYRDPALADVSPPPKA